jgi:hypothetical protein
MEYDKWVKVATICVDSGIIFVGDPCYSITSDADYNVRTWNEFCKNIFDPKSQVAEEVSAAIKGNDEKYDQSLGLVIRSGLGDGCYPVYVKYSDEGNWGVRVEAVMIDFLGELEVS